LDETRGKESREDSDGSRHTNLRSSTEQTPLSQAHMPANTFKPSLA